MVTSNTANILDVRLANGNKCKIKNTKLVGYCHCKHHSGYLTAALLREKDCLAKRCLYLEKHEDHPFWIQLQKENEKREKEKAKHISSLSEIRSRLVNSDETLEELVKAAQQICDEEGFPIVITNIAHKSNAEVDYEYIINYVSDDLYDDWHAYFNLALLLGKKCGGKYTLKHVKLPNGEYASIDDWNTEEKIKRLRIDNPCQPE